MWPPAAAPAAMGAAPAARRYRKRRHNIAFGMPIRQHSKLCASPGRNGAQHPDPIVPYSVEACGLADETGVGRSVADDDTWGRGWERSQIRQAGIKARMNTIDNNKKQSA